MSSSDRTECRGPTCGPTGSLGASVGAYVGPRPGGPRGAPTTRRNVGPRGPFASGATSFSDFRNELRSRAAGTVSASDAVVPGLAHRQQESLLRGGTRSAHDGTAQFVPGGGLPYPAGSDDLQQNLLSSSTNEQHVLDRSTSRGRGGEGASFVNLGAPRPHAAVFSPDAHPFHQTLPANFGSLSSGLGSRHSSKTSYRSDSDSRTAAEDLPLPSNPPTLGVVAGRVQLPPASVLAVSLSKEAPTTKQQFAARSHSNTSAQSSNGASARAGLLLPPPVAVRNRIGAPDAPGCGYRDPAGLPAGPREWGGEPGARTPGSDAPQQMEMPPPHTSPASRRSPPHAPRQSCRGSPKNGCSTHAVGLLTEPPKTAPEAVFGGSVSSSKGSNSSSDPVGPRASWSSLGYREGSEGRTQQQPVDVPRPAEETAPQTGGGSVVRSGGDLVGGAPAARTDVGGTSSDGCVLVGGHEEGPTLRGCSSQQHPLPGEIFSVPTSVCSTEVVPSSCSTEVDTVSADDRLRLEMAAVDEQIRLKQLELERGESSLDLLLQMERELGEQAAEIVRETNRKIQKMNDDFRKQKRKKRKQESCVGSLTFEGDVDGAQLDLPGGGGRGGGRALATLQEDDEEGSSPGATEREHVGEATSRADRNGGMQSPVPVRTADRNGGDLEPVPLVGAMLGPDHHVVGEAFGEATSRADHRKSGELDSELPLVEVLERQLARAARDGVDLATPDTGPTVDGPLKEGPYSPLHDD